MTQTLRLHRAASQHWLFSVDSDARIPTTPAPLPLRGGLLIIDVLAPDTTPWAEVHDLDEARLWIADLFGAEALAAAVTLAENDTTELPGVAPPSGHLLTRLALARWLHRWWPSSDVLGIARLDQHLLRAEIGALTWAISEDYLEPDEPIEDWFGAQEWAAATSAVAVDPGTPAARRQAYARALNWIVRAAEDLVPDDPAIETLLTTELPWPAESVAIENVATEQNRFALAAGGEQGRGGIDWWIVPPRSVGAREDALTWRELAATVVIEVTVGDEPVDGLLARAYAAGEILPFIGPLTRENSRYHGSIHNRSNGPIELVEVYQPGMARPPADPVSAREWRDRVRRVAALRTTAAVTGAAVGGVAPFAAEILATRARGAPAEPPRPDRVT